MGRQKKWEGLGMEDGVGREDGEEREGRSNREGFGVEDIGRGEVKW